MVGANEVWSLLYTVMEYEEDVSYKESLKRDLQRLYHECKADGGMCNHYDDLRSILNRYGINGKAMHTNCLHYILWSKFSDYTRGK